MAEYDATIQRTVIPVHLYLSQNFMLGNLQTVHPRLSDALDVMDDVLEIHDVLVIPYDDPSARQTHPRALVAIRDIIFACDRPNAGYQPSGGSLATPRSRRQVTVGCRSFTIVGSVHLTPGGDPAARFFGLQKAFVPLTQVTIRAAHSLKIEEATVLVNREYIGFVLL